MEKLTLPHRLPTLAALAPTPSPLLQQRFMEKETSPEPDRARIAPSSQELRHRNSPVKSPGGSTRECEKQQFNHAPSHNVTEGYAAEWTREELREASQRIADRVEAHALGEPQGLRAATARCEGHGAR